MRMAEAVLRLVLIRQRALISSTSIGYIRSLSALSLHVFFLRMLLAFKLLVGFAFARELLTGKQSGTDEV